MQTKELYKILLGMKLIRFHLSPFLRLRNCWPMIQANVAPTIPPTTGLSAMPENANQRLENHFYEIVKALTAVRECEIVKHCVHLLWRGQCRQRGCKPWTTWPDTTFTDNFQHNLNFANTHILLICNEIETFLLSLHSLPPQALSRGWTLIQLSL